LVIEAEPSPPTTSNISPQEFAEEYDNEKEGDQIRPRLSLDRRLTVSNTSLSAYQIIYSRRQRRKSGVCRAIRVPNHQTLHVRFVLVGLLQTNTGW
jgi:hypothetical protein